MLPLYVALVSEVNALKASEVNRVAAALQKQGTRDFAPIWNVSAIVSAFSTLEDVPLGYWPIIIRDDIDVPGAAGIHMDKDGQPFALVTHSDDWSLTTSHEFLEMLADPFGNRLMAGPSPKTGQGRVEFLVEVCDPSEAMQYAYQVNGIVVSDFYTPAFFDPVAAPGVRYSFTGAITKPRLVLKGGYLSWHDPVGDHWWQEVYFSSRRQYRDLGVFGRLTGSLRATIDAMTTRPASPRVTNLQDVLLAAVVVPQAAIQHATDSKAAAWHAQIEALKTGGGALG